MNFTLRDISPDDTEACVAILRGWIDEKPWLPMVHERASMEAFWRSHLDEARGWVVTVHDEIQGFCTVKDKLITALYLRDTLRGSGVGTRLLDLAKAENEWLTLWAFRANTQALAFYKREGFLEIGSTDGKNDEKLPDVNMLWLPPELQK